MNKPNVILVLTDDQGYGDLGCTGNKNINTPNIDKFYDDAVRFTDFHVAPLCAPTRGGIMSANRALRNGVWATCWGRSILKESEYTLANCFKDNGYKTGMFGKWHLGDNYPYRPEDRGFDRVVAHKGGGVGQTPDFWGNNYFDDTYFTDSKPVSYDGYCTDVWFEQAEKFIMDNKDKPFFAYVATNAPHAPFLVDEKYTKQYQNNDDIVFPEFYGMISNIDENFGKLEKMLKDNGLYDNTILIFMTDNGSSGGYRMDKDGYCIKGYSANMRGAKGSYYEGGHRAPFFIKYPNKDIKGGKDVDELCTYLDIMPTLADLCDIKLPTDKKFDGISFAKTFDGEKMPEDRCEFLQYRQNTETPDKWTNAVLWQKYRLICGKELYDISKDPEQRHDISTEYPEIVEKLRQAHEKWWDEVEEEVKLYAPIILGNEKENPTVLNSMDVLGDVAWNQYEVAKAKLCTGKWDVKFDRVGKYTFKLARWPQELSFPIDEMISDEELSKIPPHWLTKTPNPKNIIEQRKFDYTDAKLIIRGKEYTQKVHKGDIEICFTVDIDDISETKIEAWFYDEKEQCGAYYVTVEKI